MNTIIIEGLSFSLPLFIIAIGGIYSEGSGITNLALEGLLGFGAFFGGLSYAVLSRTFAGDPIVLIYASLGFAMIGGALLALLHALMCIKFKANQVISGVVINMLSVALTAFWPIKSMRHFSDNLRTSSCWKSFPRLPSPCSPTSQF